MIYILEIVSASFSFSLMCLLIMTNHLRWVVISVIVILVLYSWNQSNYNEIWRVASHVHRGTTQWKLIDYKDTFSDI